MKITGYRFTDCNGQVVRETSNTGTDNAADIKTTLELNGYYGIYVEGRWEDEDGNATWSDARIW